jgi:predicted nucleic acid-binding protein
VAEDGAIYLDSALVAKFYSNEPGRDVIRDLARAAGRVVSSAIAKAEIVAAFHRKLREGSIENTTFKALQGQFAHDVSAGLWTLVPVTDVLLENVQTLFAGLNATVYLRSLDALHLVTAKAEKFDRLYSNDRRLLDACAKIGFDGVNPV